MINPAISQLFAQYATTQKMLTVRLWMTNDKTGVHLWRNYPEFDDDLAIYHGGEMLELIKPGVADMPPICCLGIDVPFALLSQ
jgi:hypothetical protein